MESDTSTSSSNQAYNFCINNGLEPVISSITIERLNRAGNLITKAEDDKALTGLLDDKKPVDTGYKVYKVVDAKRQLIATDKEQSNQGVMLAITETENIKETDILRNMLIVAGVDNPLTTKIKTIVPNTLYEITDEEQETKKYIIINSQKLFEYKDSETQKKIDAILNDTTVKKYVDAYTADINITLRQYYDKNLTFIAGNTAHTNTDN